MQNSDLMRRISFERKPTVGYYPGLIKFAKNRKTTESSQNELTKDMYRFKAMPLIELNTDKEVCWETLASKNFLNSKASSEEKLFEEFMLGFCPDEQKLKTLKEIKTVLNKDLFESNVKKRQTSFEDAYKQSQKVPFLLFAHSLISKNEQELIKSAELGAKKKSFIQDNRLSGRGAIRSNRSIALDDSFLKPLDIFKPSSFRTMISPSNFLILRPESKSISARLLGLM